MEDAVQLPEHVRLSLTELHCLLHCLSLGPVALPVALPFLDPVAAAYITTDCGAAAACRCPALPGNKVRVAMSWHHLPQHMSPPWR